MENNVNPNLLAGGSIPSVQKQLVLLGCFKILVAYVFVVLVTQNLVLFVFPTIARAIQTDVTADYVVAVGRLLSHLSGLVASGYFTFLMIRKYFPAATISLSMSQIGLLRCSNTSAALAVSLAIIYAVTFEYFLPSRYPADPVLLENMGSHFDGAPVWKKLSLLLITVCIAPIVEEIFFRGFLYKTVSGCSGKVTAALIVTAIFVLLHYQVFSYWVAVASLLTGSITLILMREISASLIPPILLHQFYNLGVAIFQ